MIFNGRKRIIKKKQNRWNHKSWNIINKRKMMKENRLRRQHSLEIRKEAVSKARKLKELVNA